MFLVKLLRHDSHKLELLAKAFLAITRIILLLLLLHLVETLFFLCAS